MPAIVSDIMWKEAETQQVKAGRIPTHREQSFIGKAAVIQIIVRNINYDTKKS